MLPTQADVEALITHGAVLRSSFRWELVGKTNYKAECWVDETYEAARVKLVGNYNSRTKNLSYTLVWAGCRIRSLDVGGPPHPNPDGQLLESPHKHRWTDAAKDRSAYSPDDITATDREGILIQFLAESNIRFEGQYIDAFEQGSLL